SGLDRGEHCTRHHLEANCACNDRSNHSQHQCRCCLQFQCNGSRSSCGERACDNTCDWRTSPFGIEPELCGIGQHHREGSVCDCGACQCAVSCAPRRDSIQASGNSCSGVSDRLQC